MSTCFFCCCCCFFYFLWGRHFCGWGQVYFLGKFCGSQANNFIQLFLFAIVEHAKSFERISVIDSFSPNVPFLYPLKTQKMKKWSIRLKWVKHKHNVSRHFAYIQKIIMTLARKYGTEKILAFATVKIIWIEIFVRNGLVISSSKYEVSCYKKDLKVLIHIDK